LAQYLLNTCFILESVFFFNASDYLSWLKT